MILDARAAVGRRDVLFVVLDTLRYDVAQAAWADGATPVLARWLPATGWERRHSPATFTYAAHHAFFAGFLPTPPGPGPHPRLFAARFPGAASVDARTAEFDAPTWVEGLAQHGYRTICVGGVGFFNPASPLGAVLPGLFHERHWSEELGVTAPDSTAQQVTVARDALTRCGPDERALLFLNVSAIHQPNRHYVPGAEVDDLGTHRAALEYVDGALAPLFEAFRGRGGALCVVCSDHGTAYGEGGLWGHRAKHDVILDVPFAAFLIEPEEDS